MKLIFLLSLVLLSASLSAQTPEELNLQSKEALDRQDYKKAFPLIKLAAEKGNAEAEYNYGVCFQQAFEVEKSDSVANIWLRTGKNDLKNSPHVI